MTNFLSAWYLKIISSGLSYKTGADDCQINYSGNNIQEAILTFPNSSDLYTNVFTNEQEVQVFIGDPSAGGIKMLHGFIDDINTTRQPSKETDLIIHVIDWTSYLASKRIFEAKYFRGATPQAVYQAVASTITDGVDTLSSAGVSAITYDELFVGEFQGGYCKDVLNQLAEQYNAEYFGDEALVLQAFTTGSRALEFSVGNTFRIRDIAPSLSRDLMILHRKPYSLKLDNAERVRTVTATNLVNEAFPSDLKAFEEKHYFQGKNYGKKFSEAYSMGISADYDVNVVGNTFEAATLIGAEQIGNPVTETTLSMPTVRLNVAGPTQNITMFVIPRDESGSTLLNLGVDEWQELSFYIYNGLSGATITTLKLQLWHDKVGTHYWERNITAYVVLNGWSYFRFKLPTTTSNTETYTGVPWTKVGTPTHIDYLEFPVTPSTGYTANSYVKFGQLFFGRTKRASTTVGGNPPTEKIIVKKNLKTFEALQQFASAELLRINKLIVSGSCTLLGNTNFKNPGYIVDVDFTATLGTGRSATGVNGARLENIKHYLEDSIHYMDLTFNNAFDRQ